MQIKNTWVGYLQRGYGDIMTTLIGKLKNITSALDGKPLITDYSKGNILIIILEMFAGLTEQLNWYIDNVARELFISTARRFTSVLKLATSFGYRVKASSPATVDITLTFIDINGEPAPLPLDGSFTIPVGSRFRESQAGLEYRSISTVEVQPLTYIAIIPVAQISPIQENRNFMETPKLINFSGTAHQYVDGSLRLVVTTPLGMNEWEMVDNFAFSGPRDTHFRVGIGLDLNPTIYFGDGYRGMELPTPCSVQLNYNITEQENGNVAAGAITEWMDKPSDIFLNSLGIFVVNITNNLQAAGGAGIEDIERVRNNAPLALRTQDRAISRGDYSHLALQIPGVGSADAKYLGQNRVDLFISPQYGGVASQALRLQVDSFMSSRVPLGIDIKSRPAGETYIHLSINVYSKPLADKALVRNQVIAALLQRYGLGFTSINNPVRLSDIHTISDTQVGVEYTDIISLYSEPYVRPGNNEINPLLPVPEFPVKINKGTSSTSIIVWTIMFQSTNEILLYSGDILVGTYVNNGIEWNIIQPEFNFILPVSLIVVNPGYNWSFTTYPFNANLEIHDGTLVVLRAFDIVNTLQVIELQ